MAPVIEAGSTEKVEVVGWLPLKVTNHGLCVELEVRLDCEDDRVELNLYPQESKALRKALKRAEKRVKTAR